MTVKVQKKTYPDVMLEDLGYGEAFLIDESIELYIKLNQVEIQNTPTLGWKAKPDYCLVYNVSRNRVEFMPKTWVITVVDVEVKYQNAR